MIRLSTLVLVVVALSLPPPPEAMAGEGSAGRTEQLMELPIEDLMKIPVVTASKASEELVDAPGVVTVISAQEIGDFGGATLFEILNRAPATYMAGSYLYPQNKTGLRGDLLDHVENHVLYLIDGRPFRDYTQGGVNSALLLSFPVDAIEQIEIIRGPGSVLYGTNAYVGVVNIITKKREERRWVDLTLGAGSFRTGYGTVASGLRTEELEFRFDVRASDQDGWDFAATDELGVRDSTNYGARALSFFTALRHKGLTFDAFLSSSEETVLGPLPIWPDDTLHQDRIFMDLGYRHDLSEAWSIEGHLTFNDSKFDFVFEPVPPALIPTEGTQPKIDNESRTVVLEGTARAMLTPKVNLTIGALADRRSGSTSSPQGSLSLISEYGETWWSAYAQIDYAPSRVVRLVGGLQWNNPDGIDAAVVPRIGAIFTLSPAWGLKLLAGEAFRAPNEIERALSSPVLVGNPAVEPESITTAELQVNYHQEKAQVAVAFFDSTMEDLVVRVPSATPGVSTFVNAGELSFRGVEVEGRYSFLPSVYLVGSATFQESKDDAGDREVTPVPEFMAKVGVSYSSRSGVSASLFDTYFGAPPNVTGLDGPNPPPQAVHLLTANVRLDFERMLERRKGPGIALNLHGYNLLDETLHNPEFVRRNINTLPLLPGISFDARVELRW